LRPRLLAQVAIGQQLHHMWHQLGRLFKKAKVVKQQGLLVCLMNIGFSISRKTNPQKRMAVATMPMRKFRLPAII